MYGKGYSFCISRPGGGNLYSSYRLSNESTFYFIYFKNKPKSDDDHIMVLDHSNRGYEWTFADNNTQRINGGWDDIVSKYPELKPYENLLVNKKLDAEEQRVSALLRKFSILNQSVNDPNALDEMVNMWDRVSYSDKVVILRDFSLREIPDVIWGKLDSVLRNEFFGVSPNLTYEQAISMTPKEIKRYNNTRKTFYPDILNSGDLNGLLPNIHDDYDFIIADSYASLYYAYHIKDTDLDFDDDLVESILEWFESADEFVKSVLGNDIKNWRRVNSDFYEELADSEEASEFLPDEIRNNLGGERGEYVEESNNFNNLISKLLKEITHH